MSRLAVMVGRTTSDLVVNVISVAVMLLVGLAALAVFAARDIWQNIFTVGFGDEEQSHILIAPVVVVWLAWLRRDRLRLTPHAPSIWGPLVIAGGYGLSLG